MTSVAPGPSQIQNHTRQSLTFANEFFDASVIGICGSEQQQKVFPHGEILLDIHACSLEHPISDLGRGYTCGAAEPALVV